MNAYYVVKHIEGVYIGVGPHGGGCQREARRWATRGEAAQAAAAAFDPESWRVVRVVRTPRHVATRINARCEE